jgi:hypothetical protein
VCITQCTSARAAWITLWMTKPARLTECSVACSGAPSWPTLIKFVAVTSS